MDHSRHVPLDPEELTLAILKGAAVYDAADQEVGTVSDVQGVGPTSEIIVDVGGFLGIGTKPVAVSTEDLEFMRDEQRGVHAITSLTKEALEERPEHEGGH